MGTMTSSAVLAFLCWSGMFARKPNIWLKKEVTHSPRLPVEERATACAWAAVMDWTGSREMSVPFSSRRSG